MNSINDILCFLFEYISQYRINTVPLDNKFEHVTAENCDNMNETSSAVRSNLNTVDERIDVLFKRIDVIEKRTEKLDKNIDILRKRMEIIKKRTEKVNETINNLILLINPYQLLFGILCFKDLNGIYYVI
ncbi:hypothetical protein RclHR1_01460012 [Rhizophagus clarus]|uniref:Uncharacterized protein n=1 Tax=Rhizophagus clarus TaxID=94130 RepID=A0A2Z6QHE0_9GLOM|nr:hypothetical protein RclHR1_01460012 [Rhizophagus clarus]